MSESLIRHFTHITIPKEIWLRRDISMQAKALWAELRSLHCPIKGGCYASEEYLCEFIQLQRRRFYKILKELKDAGLMEVVSFNGRQTVRKALVPDVDYGLSSKQVSTKVHNSSAQKCTPQVHKSAHPSYIENKEYNKEEEESPKSATSPPPSGETLPPSASKKLPFSEEAYQAALYFDVKLSDLYPKRKTANISQWATDLDRLNRIDKRSWDEIKELWGWCLEDSFWVGNILSPSKLREKWDQLIAQSKPPENKGNRIHWNKVEAREAQEHLRSKRDGRADKMKIWENRVERSDTKEVIPFDIPRQEFIFKLCEAFQIKRKS